MRLTIDLHTHLLEKGVRPHAYWKAVKARKLDAVAISEHYNEKPGYAYRLLEEKKPKGISLIPGIELDTSIGHVLALAKTPEVYGVKGLFEKKLGIKKALALAEQNGIVLSISHPWGLSYDSAAYLMGEKKLEKFVEQEKVGVEAFNGMFGNVSSFFYATNWVRKPMNFFDFLEKSRFGKKTRLGKIGKKGKEKLDRRGKEIIERCTKPYLLAEKASFATAGSDAHKPARIGTALMKVESKSKKPEDILESVQNKRKVHWLGPYVKETPKGFEMEKPGVQKAEVLSGLKYAAKRAIAKKVLRKERGKKK